MDFEFEDEKEKLKRNLKIPIKQRLEWLESALAFVKELPAESIKRQKYIKMQENKWNNEFENFFKNKE